ncbi:MAG: hypothetical protein JJT99_09645 [Rhodobacteraceae bacterium]|nr:hypothetical protein [Paracoccaceae bacterium]
MFDWDRDCDEVLHHTRVAPHARPVAGAMESLDGGDAPVPRLVELLTPARAMLLAAGLGVAMLIPEQVADASNAAPLVDFVALAELSAPAQPVPPPDLEVYDETQYRAFMAGLRDFGDAQLRDYADLIAQDMDRSAGFLKPAFRDALRVTQHEMGQRGLSLQAELPIRLDSLADGGGSCKTEMAGLALLPVPDELC